MSNSFNISTRVIHPQWSKGQQGLQLDAQASSSANSELGGVAQDVGAVIGKWKGNLNACLNQWLSDVDAMSDLIDAINDAAGVLHMLIPSIKEFLQEGEDSVDMNPTVYDEMINAMEGLGIPSDEIAQSTGSTSTGYKVMSVDDLIYNVKLMVQYIEADASQVSADQQAETKDLMAVMFCYNAVKMNEESLTGLLETLTSLSQTLMQNVS